MLRLKVCVGVIIVGVSFFISCTNRNVQEMAFRSSKLDTIKVNPLNEMLNLTDLIKDINFIKLEMGGSCFIGDISQLYFTGDNIIVVDKDISKSIFIFNKNGKFKAKINSIGRGPNEYMEIFYTSLSYDNKNICILDLKGRKLVYYNLSGEFVKSHKLPFLFTHFAFQDNDQIICNTGSDYNPAVESLENYMLLSSDLDGKFISPAFKRYYNPEIFSYTTDFPIHVYDNRVYFNPIFSDIIYEVARNEITPKYCIDIELNKIPVINKDVNDQVFSDWMKKGCFFKGDYIELDKHMILSIATPNGYPLVHFSKTSKKSRCISTTLNDYLHFFFKYPVARYKDNSIVTVVSPMELLALKKEIISQHKTVEIKELFNGLTENDNPILFIYELNNIN